ncbi:MAG: hypothetical protein ICV77_01335 [Cyanobacteria bacterium Co-bin8]|nr:hypothetical protein [Cyanobacteria bacterium Co-bin8]
MDRAGNWGNYLDRKTYRDIVQLSGNNPKVIEFASKLIGRNKAGEDIVALLQQAQGRVEGFLDVLSQRFNEFSGEDRPFEIGGSLPLDSAHKDLLKDLIKPDGFPSPDDLHEFVQAIDFGRRRGGHFWYAQDGKQGIDGYFKSLYTGEESFVSFKNLPSADIRNVHKELMNNTTKVRDLSLGEANAEFFAYTRFSKEQMKSHLHDVATTASQREYAEVFDRVTFICRDGEELILDRNALATLRETSTPDGLPN